MGDIKFEFNIDKLIHSIAFFCAKNIHDLTKLKAAKLLYFADKKHLLGYGSPILGDTYFCMQFGPVPSFAMNEMSEAINRSEVSSDDASDYSIMNKMLRVKRSTYPYFEAKRPYDPAVFADSELRILNEVAREYGRKSARRLVDLTHREPTWTIANEGRNPHGRTQIAYELFFEGAPAESIRFLAKLKAEFSGEAIPLAGDAKYSEFVGGLRSYVFEPEFDLDKDHEREKLARTVLQP